MAAHVHQQVALRHKLFHAQLALEAALLVEVDLVQLFLLPRQALVLANLARERRQPVLTRQVLLHQVGRADVRVAQLAVELRIAVVVHVFAQRAFLRKRLSALVALDVLALEMTSLVDFEIVDICVGFTASVADIGLGLRCVVDIIVAFEISL